MHYCSKCQAKRSGDHEREHKDNPLFLSYNMRLNLRRKYPDIYILPQKAMPLKLEDALRRGQSLNSRKYKNIWVIYRKQRLK